MTRILITGGSGFLGQNIAPMLARKHRVFVGYFKNTPMEPSGSPAAIDITFYPRLTEQLENIQPDLVVHAAAMAKPDECELHPEEARLVIVEGTRNVARLCHERRCRLIHISTDLVFDGCRGYYTETDPVRGISVYASCKIEAERVVQEIIPGATVLRVSLMYGRGSQLHPGYVEMILRNWRLTRPMTFFTDQYRTPLFAPQVAEIVEALLSHPDFSGIVHCGGGARVSRFTFAQLLAERVNAPARLILPGNALDSRPVAERGADCSLISDRLVRELGVRPLPCAEGLDLLVTDGYLKPL